MGQYLTVGIVNKIVVWKKECPNQSTFDDIAAQVGRHINLSKYVPSEAQLLPAKAGRLDNACKAD